MDISVFLEAAPALIDLGTVEPEVARRSEVGGQCSDRLSRHLVLVARLEDGTFGHHVGPREGPYGLV